MTLKMILIIRGIYVRIEVGENSDNKRIETVKAELQCTNAVEHCIEVLVSDLSYVICELFTVTHKRTLM